MNFLSHPIVARILWVFPLLLLVISAYLFWAGSEQHEAASVGVPVQADVVGVFTRERSEITTGNVRLRYTPPGETESIERAVELPLTLLKSIEARDLSEITIRIVPGHDQLVLEPYKRGQWIMTFSFAAMALIGALGMGTMVRGWNRFLSTHGDPAEAYG